MTLRTSNILNGGPDPKNYADGCLSLGQLFIKRLTKHGDKILMIDGVTGAQVSGLEIRDRSIQVALGLQAIGVGVGDRVGLFSLNRMEFPYVLIGAFICGATVAPMNVTYTTSEIQHAISLSRPKIIFTSTDLRQRIDHVKSTNSFIQQVVAFGDEFEQFVQPFKSDPTFKCAHQRIDPYVAMILCSSGTTGLPKGVQLTQKNIMIAIEQHATRPNKLERKMAPDPIVLSTIAWFHAFGSMTLMCSLLWAEVIVFLPKFEEVAFLRAIAANRVNFLYLVPPLMVILAKSPAVSNFDLTSLKVIWYGAAPLSKESEDAVQRRLRIPFIRQAYGMTEGTFAFTGQTDEHRSSGSVGVVRAGILCRVVDESSRENLPAFKAGELCFKGSVIMKGYVNDEEATRRTIDADGWLHTGDIGYYNMEGELFIVDRLKELIKYNGFQVPPAEVEGLLLQHPRVADAGVVGKPNEAAGELATAFIVRQPNVELTAEEVVRFVAERISTPKRLHGGVIFMDVIPKSPTGKILRRELRGLLSKLQAKL